MASRPRGASHGRALEKARRPQDRWMKAGENDRRSARRQPAPAVPPGNPSAAAGALIRVRACTRPGLCRREDFSRCTDCSRRAVALPPRSAPAARVPPPRGLPVVRRAWVGCVSATAELCAFLRALLRSLRGSTAGASTSLWRWAVTARVIYALTLALHRLGSLATPRERGQTYLTPHN